MSSIWCFFNNENWLREASVILETEHNINENYKILLAVDDSPGTAKAVKYGVRVAQAFNIKVELITISKDKHLVEENKKASDYASKMMRRSGVEAQRIFKTGDPVDTIIETAGTNRIIIMGASSQSPITKFFMGSKPLNVMENCNCPVLIVK